MVDAPIDGAAIDPVPINDIIVAVALCPRDLGLVPMNPPLSDEASENASVSLSLNLLLLLTLLNRSWSRVMLTVS